MDEFTKLKRFLEFFNIYPGCTISQVTLELIVKTARNIHGKEFSAVVMDCFDPSGENDEVDAELYLYHFDWTWEQLSTQYYGVN